jgi:hypothetical protein
MEFDPLDGRRAMTAQWQPIETAPRDTPILVTDGKIMVVLMRGDVGPGTDWPDPVGFGGYEWDWEFDWDDLTHWTPLPAPPA